MLAAVGVRITQREYQRTILKSLPDELAKFAAQLLVSARHSGFILDTDTLINSVIEELEHLKNWRARSQRGKGEKQKEGLTDDSLTAMGSEGSRRRHRRGNCHSCGKPGHRASECREPEENNTAGASNTDKSGSTPPTDSENQPTGSANTVAEHSFEGEGFWTVEEEEVAPTLTFGADLDPFVGDPDETWFGPQDLEQTFTWDGPDDWLTEVEGEGTAMYTAVEKDVDPRVDLQGNGVSHPTTPKKIKFRPFLLSPLLKTSEAARTQRSPPVNAGMSGIEGPESTGHANTALPPLDTAPPEEVPEPLREAIEPLSRPSPKPVRAPIDAEGHLELFWGEALQRATWHESQGSARAFEGDEPFGEAHGYPLDLLDSYFEAPVEGEPGIATLKAQRPVFDERARAHFDLLPGPSAATTDLDVCTKASVPLEGEQNFDLPCVGSEQYATPCAPQSPSFSPSPLLPLSLEIIARGIAPGERATPVKRGVPRLEILKPPDWSEPPLEEPGGVPLGLVHAAEKAGAEAVERVSVDAHEPA